MSTSSNASNSGDSGASFGGSSLEFFSTTSESLNMETETEIRENPASKHAESLWPKRAGYKWIAKGVRTSLSIGGLIF